MWIEFGLGNDTEYSDYGGVLPLSSIDNIK